MRLSLALCASLLLAGPTLAAPVVTEAPLRAHLAFLADDLMEGRGTGQRGGELAVRYLESQAAIIGLKPANGNSYRQSVKFVGSTTRATSTIKFDVGGRTLAPKLGSEIAIVNANGSPEVRFDAPLVFVGYGIEAPDEQWNDYAGVDVKGKVLVIMVNDPKPTAAEPNRFGGKSLTYYGRWVYKFDEARRRGAAGVLLIHTTESASYDWSVAALTFGRENFTLGNGNPVQGWIHENTARALFTAAGKDLDALRAQAEVRGFKPVDLGVHVRVALDSAQRTVEQFNVAGIIPGSDPALKDQAVIYSAHWDHHGKAEGSGDRIYNGAVDNASGAAALLAMAQAAVNKPARRTQIFLWPCGEEQGLLGATGYMREPLWPLAKTAADLNLDSMNFVGKTRDMGVAGAEHSTLLASAGKVARAMGLKLAPSTPDLGGAYFRADHFIFARAGVPAFNVGSAVFSGDGSFDFEHDQVASSAKMVAFKERYHQVTDEYDPSWDLSGMVQQAQFTLNLGYEVANTTAMPAWNKGDPLGQTKR
ncbi:MAG: M28 family peptidase [Massilia sp.]